MNYLQFYKNSQRRLSETLLSMWASGQESNQKYFKKLLEEEPLLAEPVFQATFPWMPSSLVFEQLTDVFDENFIKSLDQIEDPDYHFPKDRAPYLHQVDSWKELLLNQKSIVVTSGTGSGKTECFMIPVIQDLLRQKIEGHTTGVQAIFLYPLNALMNSQQKRMRAWCKAVNPQITFAIYNGNTEEENIPRQKQNEAYPELITRKAIRETVPQILFTNPTMLEYMLVRKKDQDILKQSQGKLRWILLDETHTYSGSAAAELSMQIRRILDAFGVTIQQVRFASTSATIGSDNEEQLKRFIAQLTGKSLNEIAVINGKQVLPKIKDTQKTDIVTEMLRQDLVLGGALSAREIGRRYKPDATIEESLEIIDKLGNKIPDLVDTGKSDALLPTRAHFFIRSIGGVFVCTNPRCDRHMEERPLIGSMTTYMKTTCECGAPLLELTSCNLCGNHLLVAEKEQGNYPARFRLQSKTEEDLFDLVIEEDSENDLENESENLSWTKIILAKGVKEAPSKSADLIPCGIDIDNGTIVHEGEFTECKHSTTDNILCPHCGNRTDKIKHLRTSTEFLSRVLSSTLLEQADPMPNMIAGSLWDGRKYISFTDNRQGTAKSALAQNTEVERNWIRTAVFHYLAGKKREGVSIKRQLNALEQKEYDQLLPLRNNGIEVIIKRLQELENIKSGTQIIPNPNVSLNELCEYLDNNASLDKLFLHVSSHSVGKQNYLHALLLDQFGRRPRKGNSPETMGFIKVIYPDLKKCERPASFEKLGWSSDDWRDFLKICLDFFVRENTHIIIQSEIRPYITQDYFSNHLYASDCNLHDERTGRRVKRWPSLNKQEERQSRLVLLLCAGMGVTDISQIDETCADIINSIINSAWRYLTSHVLTVTNDQNPEYNGYKLNIFEREKVKLELLDKAWLCPVTYVPMDTIFRGYSPAMKGNINKDNFERFKVKEEIFYPYFPFAYKQKTDIEGNLIPSSDEEIFNWKDDNLIKQKEIGIWSDLNERILLNYPIFLAAEHSAQQNKIRLKKIEEQFNQGKINILSCSTTMEMGVDIGGISEVVMNNVPPKPANYLQRAGRAGRRAESKAMAITFCAPNPIGTNVINDPKWAMTHITAMPIVKLESSILIQRHVNSFLLGTYISSIEGADVKSNIESFFYNQDAINNFRYDLFHQYLMEFLAIVNIGIQNRYKELVRGTIKESIPFEQSVKSCLTCLEDIFNRLSSRKLLLDETEEKLLAIKGFSQTSPEIKAINYQRKQLLGQNLLGFFAENDFIPSAGIPTGIVDFNIKVYDKLIEEGSENNLYKSNPSLNITRALSEYAPGNQVVLNEKCYESAGIIMKSQWNDSRRAILQSCRICGFTRLGFGILSECPSCKNKGMSGIQSIGDTYTEVIEPAGFSVDYFSEPSRNIKTNHGQQNFVEPILLNMLPWNSDTEGAHPKIEIRNSTEESEILYYNKGRGFGYATCIHCGRAMQEFGNSADTQNPLDNHTRLNGGAGNSNNACTGNENIGAGIKRNVLLGGRLQTDFIELRFRNKENHLVNDPDTIWSLGVILSRKLAEYLGINNQEIGFGVKKYPSYFTVFIFDTAKGGAGYSSLFADYASEILDSAYTALDCTCEKACTKCLIDRDSQWFLNNLDRIKARDWLQLEKECRVEVPESITSVIPGANRVTSNLITEIAQVAANPELRRITFFISNKVKEWKPENWKLREIVDRLKLQGKKVNFALHTPEISDLSARELASVIEAKGQYQFQTISSVVYDGLCSLMLVEYENKESLIYFSESGCNEFSEKWGLSESPIYKGHTSSQMQFAPWNIDLESLMTENKFLFEFKIKEKNTTLVKFWDTLYKIDTANWNKIIPKIKDCKVKITYQDIYLKDALGCLMLLNLIKSITKNLNMDIQSLNFYLAGFNNSRYAYSDDIDKDWIDSGERKLFLKESCTSILNKVPVIQEEGFLPHWRELVIMSDDFELIIRPNGGIKNGWKLDSSEGSISQEDIDFDEDLKLFNISQREGILYNVVFEKK